MILDDFYMFCAQFSYVITYVMYFEGHVQFADQCASVKFANSAENSVLQELRFQEVSVCLILPGGTTHKLLLTSLGLYNVQV
jgi:hypothetical protein